MDSKFSVVLIFSLDNTEFYENNEKVMLDFRVNKSFKYVAVLSAAILHQRILYHIREYWICNRTLKVNVI